MSEPTRLVVAQVRGIHGLRGLVRVEVLTDRPEVRFAAGNVLHVEGTDAPLTIASARAVEDGPGWRLGFEEVPDRAAAERLRDSYLEVAVEPAAELADDEAYWHEVIGARVRGVNGRSLGVVADVYRAGEREVYVVRDGPVGEFDLPAVKGIITEFAPRRGEIVVDEAALALDAPAVDAAAPKARRRPRWSRHGKGGAGPPGSGGESRPIDEKSSGDEKPSGVEGPA